ncbi:MAG: hypothetical protein D4S01_09105 [Dehalococcoidia bacterium]|nr:MAG: hypothetical protein D4S01_09105 [Dehalococcoidia bacterium]
MLIKKDKYLADKWLLYVSQKEELTVNIPIQEIEKRCRHKAKRVSWYKSMQKFCYTPIEYKTCSSYELKLVWHHSMWD